MATKPKPAALPGGVKPINPLASIPAVAPKPSAPAAAAGGVRAAPPPPPRAAAPPPPPPTKPEVPRYKALFAFEGQPGEINLTKGDIVELKEKDDNGWWLVSKNGTEGWAPSNYLELLPPPKAAAPPPPPPPGRRAPPPAPKPTGLSNGAGGSARTTPPSSGANTPPVLKPKPAVVPPTLAPKPGPPPLAAKPKPAVPAAGGGGGASRVPPIPKAPVGLGKPVGGGGGGGGGGGSGISLSALGGGQGRPGGGIQQMDLAAAVSALLLFRPCGWYADYVSLTPYPVCLSPSS